jgi:DNA replication protein DnaC
LVSDGFDVERLSSCSLGGALPFLTLVSRRDERGSLLITTNQAVTHWGTVFGDDVTASALLDRLLHHSHTVMIQGDSYRLKQKRKAGMFGTTSATNA